jgi:flagellar motor component MotA
MTKINYFGALLLIGTLATVIFNKPPFPILLNIPVAIAILTGTIGAVMLGKSEKTTSSDSLKTAGNAAWLLGITIGLIGLLTLLLNIQDKTTIGPNSSFVIIAVFYGTIIRLFCNILSTRQKKADIPELK